MTALLLLSLAHAGVPLVYDGGTAEEVLAQAAEVTGLPSSQFAPIAVADLLKGVPKTLGQATIRHCAGATTRATDMRAYVVRAEAAFRGGNVDGAMDELDLGIAGLGCLSERVEPPVAAKLFLLRGGLLAKNGDAEAALAELRTSLSFAPEERWEAWLPVEGATVFESARGELNRVSLLVAPANAALSIDGVSATPDTPLALRKGLHLAQIPSTAGLRSAWLTVAGEAVLVVPGSYRRPILERLAEPTGQVEVERLIFATLGGEPAYVASQGGLWLVTEAGETGEAGEARTSTLREPPPPPVPEGRKGRK